MRRRLPHFILLFGCIALYLGLTLPRLDDLMGQDEASHYFKLTRLLLEKGWSEPGELATFSPHGYPLLNLMFCKCLPTGTSGKGQPSEAGTGAFHAPRLQTEFRLCGVLLWLITLLVVFHVDRGWLAVPILAVLPAACQSAAIIEIDQTVLPLACLLLCLAFARLQRNGNALDFCLAALALAGALWCRLTTPLILCMAMLFSRACARGMCTEMDRAPRTMACIRDAGAMLAGMALFLASWGLYCGCTGVAFGGPFRYLVSSFMETTVGQRAGGLTFYAQNLAYLWLWGFNPILHLLFLADGIRRVIRWRKKRCLEESDLYWLSAAALLLGYTVVGGALFGFPKYQIPALPLMALALSDFARQCFPGDRRVFLGALTAFAGYALLFALLPDALYFIRVEMRMHLAMGTPLQHRLFLMPVLLALPLLPMPLMCRPSSRGWRKGYLLSLLAVGLGCNLGWSLRQTLAPYSTGYIYGDRGECNELAQLIQAQGWTDAPLCVPVEIVQCLGLYDTSGLRPQDAPDAESLAGLIQQRRPPVVAISPLISPVDHYRSLMASPRLQAALAGYKRHQNGHLTYWTRHEDSAD